MIMKKLMLMFAILSCAIFGYSQEKGTTQISALNVSATEAVISVSSPSVTHYFIDNMGLTLGVANFEDVSVGARYYVKDNNFAFAGYGTGSASLELGLGKTFDLRDHVQVEPRLTLSDVLNDSRDLGLSVQLNLVF